jgi:DNA primase
MREVEEVVAPKIVQGLDDIGKDLVEKPISQRCYDFFIKPPNKPHPTNIKKETVDRYSIFERTWGYYSDRAIIPFYMRKELKGFAAIDLLGEDEWKKKHPLSDNYRKTLTAINFQVAEYLFGFDDCQKGADWLIVTEGPREVMKLWQEGFPNAVATLGINIAPGQHRLFAELMPKNIVLMYDGDARGLAAMDKIGESFVRIFGKKHVHKCLCPNGYDPKNLSANELISLFNGLKDKGFGV